MNPLHSIAGWLFLCNAAAAAEWVAAIATGCLVVAGLIQLKAIRKGAEEQRERWKREDEPKAAFELGRVESDRGSIALWCANLGTASFVVSGMTLEPVSGSEKLISLPQLKQYVFTAGTARTVDVDLAPEVFGQYHGNVAVRLHVRVPSEEVVTDAYPHWLSVIDGKRNGLKPGFDGFEKIACCKCGTRWAANLRAEGIISMANLRKQIEDVKREFQTTCPSHESSNSRVTYDESADIM